MAFNPEELGIEVRAYRYGILLAALPWTRELETAWSQALVEAPQAMLEEWAAFACKLSWSREAEEALAARFLERMAARAEPSEALKRFARGKAFKYGRRVLHLETHES